MRWQARLRHPVARSLATVALGLFVFAFGLLASSAQLHEALHHDSDSAGHCGACTFAKGQIETADVTANPSQPAASGLFAGTLADCFIPLTLCSILPPGRAPPVCFAVS